MAITLFKRYRMQYSLAGELYTRPPLPEGYELLPWREELLSAHATAKFRSFRDELDTNIFACLGQEDGCRRLMYDISGRPGFVAEATWLMLYRKPNGNIESCGTIQGVQTDAFTAAIQNIGVLPEHRGKRLGSVLIHCALEGFQRNGMRIGTLEVTSHNTGAVRLYQKLGFTIAKVVYKSAEVVEHY
ncbi:MAG: N-acetyltransferase [Pirellulaceae bacterium]